jgi:hypothetical protein
MRGGVPGFLLAAGIGHKYHMAINAAVNKKGGVNDLRQLRSGAKRNGAILTFSLAFNLE